MPNHERTTEKACDQEAARNEKWIDVGKNHPRFCWSNRDRGFPGLGRCLRRTIADDLAFGFAEAEGFRFEATRIECPELSLRMSTDCSTLSPRKNERGELVLMKWRGNVQEFVADGVLVPYINNAEEARDHPPTCAQT
jgi:hypothetical protein